LTTKALPVWRWHSRQWQQWTNIGFDWSRYRTAPQAEPPSKWIIASSLRRLPMDVAPARREARLRRFGAGCGL
jgi:hypothetical protein